MKGFTSCKATLMTLDDRYRRPDFYKRIALIFINLGYASIYIVANKKNRSRKIRLDK